MGVARYRDDSLVADAEQNGDALRGTQRQVETTDRALLGSGSKQIALAVAAAQQRAQVVGVDLAVEAEAARGSAEPAPRGFALAGVVVLLARATAFV